MSVNWVDTTTVDGVDYDLRDSGSVRYDESQSLTDAQKETARGNVGVASAGEVNDLKSAFNQDLTNITGIEQLLHSCTIGFNTESYSQGVWETKPLGNNGNAQLLFDQLDIDTSKTYKFHCEIKLSSGTASVVRGFAFYINDAVSNWVPVSTISSSYVSIDADIQFTANNANKILIVATTASSAVFEIRNIGLYSYEPNLLNQMINSDNKVYKDVQNDILYTDGFVNKSILKNIAAAWNTESYSDDIWETKPLGNNENAQISFDQLSPTVGKEYYLFARVRIKSGTVTSIKGLYFFNTDTAANIIPVSGITSDYKLIQSKVIFSSNDVTKLLIITETATDAVFQITDIVLLNTLPLALQINELSANVQYASIGCYRTFGVIGDSFASGLVYDENGNAHQNYYLSWGQNLARRLGNTCTNYSSGGATTETWLASDVYGLGKMNADDPLDLYILNLGINEQTANLGTIDDIHDGNPSLNPNTFYGNYGKIVEAIKTHAPNAFIIFATIKVANASWYEPRNTIIKNIASHYGVPVIDFLDDPFFQSAAYMNFEVGHPTANGYTGMALAIDRLYGKSELKYHNYYKNYLGN